MLHESSPTAIAVFDREGRYRQTGGRSGSGPGKFQVLGRIGWTGDTLWAVDFGGLHLFDSALRFVRTVAPQVSEMPNGVTRVIPGPRMADGSILGVPFTFGGAESEPVLLLDEGGAVRRTLARSSSMGRSVEVGLGGDRTIPVPNPWTVFPDYEPAVLDRDAQDREYRSLAESLARSGSVSLAEAEEALRRAIPAPAFHPPVGALVSGRDGTVWLRREAVRADSVDWQALDRSGDELGLVRLPAQREVHVAEAGRVWSIATDSLDIPFVQVYEIAGR